MNSTWHADPALIARYVSDNLDDINASSLEAHILTCALCRETLTAMAPTAPLEGIWQAIETVLNAPQPGFVEQVLLRLGIHEHVARLLAATPSLRLSWFAAEAFALASAAFAAQNTAGTYAGGTALFLFLVLAALAPVAGVAAAFGPGVDPSYEIGIASPMRTDRLLFIRATAVLVASIAIGSFAAIALPGLDRTMTLWLLPALGLTLATLAVATWLHPIVAASVVGVVWVMFAAAVSVASADPLAPFRLNGQLASVVSIVACLLILAQRHSVYEGEIP